MCLAKCEIETLNPFHDRILNVISVSFPDVAILLPCANLSSLWIESQPKSSQNTLRKNINATCKVLVPFFMSWIKDHRNFPHAEKAYFSQILCTNLFTSLLVSISDLPR